MTTALPLPALRPRGRGKPKSLNRRRSLREPLRGRATDMRTDAPADFVVVGIEPGDLVGAQQRASMQRRVDRAQRQRLERAGTRRTRSEVAAGTLSTRFSIRTPHWPGRYTPGSIEVIMPGSIAICGSGRDAADALRALVHVEEVADAVAGAVAVVEALLPRAARARSRRASASVPRGKRARTARSCP